MGAKGFFVFHKIIRLRQHPFGAILHHVDHGLFNSRDHVKVHDRQLSNQSDAVSQAKQQWDSENLCGGACTGEMKPRFGERKMYKYNEKSQKNGEIQTHQPGLNKHVVVRLSPLHSIASQIHSANRPPHSRQFFKTNKVRKIQTLRIPDLLPGCPFGSSSAPTRSPKRTWSIVRHETRAAVEL